MFYFYKIFHNILFYFTDLTEAYFFYNESLILLSNIFILSFSLIEMQNRYIYIPGACHFIITVFRKNTIKNPPLTDKTVFKYCSIKEDFCDFFILRFSYLFSNLLRFHCNVFYSVDRKTGRLQLRSRGFPGLW